MKKIILLFTTLLIFESINAQVNTAKTRTFFIDKIDSVCNNAYALFPIRVKNFTNISDFQGTVRWDTTILKFDSLLLNTSTSVIQLTDTTTNLQNAQGYVSFLWVDNNGLSVSVPDSSIIFTLRLKVLKAVNYSSPIYFSSIPTAQLIDTLDSSMNPGEAIDTAWKSGYIKFVDTPKIIKSGNIYTCQASCQPLNYIWNVYDCNNSLVYSDTTFSDTLNYTGVIDTCSTIIVIVNYANGNRIASGAIPTNPLPLNITTFTAQLVNRKIQLNWQTTNEINVSYFNIQSSNNGKQFINVGKQDASNKTANKYRFINSIPIEFSGLIYYRLETVDKDGKLSYSGIKQLMINDGLKTINVYPNPARSFVNIECANIKQLSVVDYMGKIIYHTNINSQSIKINTTQFAKGIYFIKFISINGDVKNEKLVVE